MVARRFLELENSKKTLGNTKISRFYKAWPEAEIALRLLLAKRGHFIAEPTCLLAHLFMRKLLLERKNDVRPNRWRNGTMCVMWARQ